MIGFGATLILAMGVGTFLAFALGALAPLLRRDLRLSRSQIGALTSVLFLTGALCSPVAGRLVDRFGGRTMQIVLFWVAGLAIVGVALSPSYTFVLLMVLVAGFPLSLANTATNKLVGEHVPAGSQGILVGFKQSGVQIGALIVGLLLPTGAVLMGWRGILLASTALPVLGVIATARLVPRTEALRRGRRGLGSMRVAVAWLAAYAFLMGVSVWTVGAYLPLYANERLGFDVSAAGFVAAVVALVAVFARLAWGRLADRRSSAPKLLALMALGGVVAQALIIGAPSVGAWMIWTAAVVAGATASAWNSVGMLAIVKDLDVDRAGQASGVVLLAFYGGSAIGPFVFGSAVDATGGYTVGWIITLVGYLVAAGAAVAWMLADRPAVAVRDADLGRWPSTGA